MTKKSRSPVLSEHLRLAVDALAEVLGSQRVLSSDIDRDAYTDPFALLNPSSHAPGAIVAPESVGEIQQVLKIANRFGVPLWPISRGKNLGYGGAAPQMQGSIVVDLTRMNRILEVDEKSGYCLLEPGVGFFDLYDYLQKNDIDLWMSVPGNAWGSVVGNALERGVGPQPYGDHAAQICGMEVLLPNGDLVRTGFGAMKNSATWQTAKHGYGPGWDSVFCQSNYGIVTKLGLWLMPAPEETRSLMIRFDKEDDLGRAVELLHPLRRNGLVEHNLALISYVGLASYSGSRSRWYQGSGLLPDEVGEQIRKELGLGWWTSFMTLYGHGSVLDARQSLIEKHLKGKVDGDLQFRRWRKGEPLEGSGAGVPSTRDMQMINWYGGRGGHLGFSPVLPVDGELAQGQYRRTRQLYDQYGLDYYGAFAVGERSIVNVNELLYNRDDADMVDRADNLFQRLVAVTATAGYGEYRTHLDYMDAVADTFDFNDNALKRLNETVKDALDPNGILAPGKQGIWPRRFRRAEDDV